MDTPPKPPAWTDEGPPLTDYDAPPQCRAVVPESAPLPRPRVPLRVIRIGDIPDPGPPRWLVRDLWTCGAFGFVGAEPKSWKSWITLTIGIGVASGRPVFGRFEVEQGRVLILNAEGGTGLARHRAGMLCRAMGIDIAALDLEVIDVDVLHLDEADAAAALLATVEARRPALLILDPLREIHTGDENDSAVIAGLLAPLRKIQSQLQAAVMVVHHSGKSASDGTSRKRGGQRLRGSSALHGASDSALYLLTEGVGARKRVTVQAEHRAAREPEPFTLAMREMIGSGGNALLFEIVEGESDDQKAERDDESRIAQREKLRSQLVRMIRLAAMPGRAPLKSKRAVATAARKRPANVNPVLDELLQEGLIVQRDDGAYCAPDQIKEVAHDVG